MAAARDGRMGAAEHRSKERILTQPQPSKVRRSDDAVVLKDGLDGFTLMIDGRALTVLCGIGVRGFEAHHHLARGV